MRHDSNPTCASSSPDVLAVCSERSGARFTALVEAAMAVVALPAGCGVETLAVDAAFLDLAAAGRAIDALCGARVVVFDCDGFEPGVLLMIGLRGAVRRGVSVCATHLAKSTWFGFIPYNLQCVAFVNLADGSDATASLARTVALSLREHEVDRDYRDLPAYDAVRRTHLQPAERDGVLVLCPYAQPYTDICWHGTLRAALTSGARQPHRLADGISARLASDTFHARLRESTTCIADWTNVRPDLFYELGVRIATSDHACLHIMADGRDWKPGAGMPHVDTAFGRWPCPPEHVATTTGNLALTHLGHLAALFQPVPYTLQGDNSGRLGIALEAATRRHADGRSVERFLHARARGAAAAGRT